MATIRDQVRRVLLEEWDSKSAADCDVNAVAELIDSGASENAIIDHLYNREREIMCFSGLGKQRLQRVARMLLALRA